MSSHGFIHNEMTVVKSVYVWAMNEATFADVGKVGELLTSPIFTANDSRWKLSLHLQRNSEEFQEFFMLMLQKVGVTEHKDAVIMVSFLDSQDNPCFSRIECVPKNNNCYRLEKFVDCSELTFKLDDLLSDNKIRIKFEIFPKDKVLENMYSPPNFIDFFNKSELSDVTFVIGKKKLYGHTIIFINRSEVFLAMFEHAMWENEENVVHIEDISYDVFAEMMRFIYSGQVNGIQNIAKDLLPAADKYALLDLKFVCGECLCDSLADDNVVELLSLADRHDIRTLKLKALNYIASNSLRLIGIPKFRNITSLNKDLLFEVIQALALERSDDMNQVWLIGNRITNRSPSPRTHDLSPPRFTRSPKSSPVNKRIRERSSVYSNTDEDLLNSDKTSPVKRYMRAKRTSTSSDIDEDSWNSIKKLRGNFNSH